MSAPAEPAARQIDQPADVERAAIGDQFKPPARGAAAIGAIAGAPEGKD